MPGRQRCLFAILAASCLLAPVIGRPGSTPERAVLLPDPAGGQRATIALDNYSFQPDHLQVQAGKPVELILESRTRLTPHNFILRVPEAGVDLAADVPAGTRQTIRFTPRQPGRFSFYCDKRLLFFKSHREKGMEGVLDVRD